MDIGMLWFDDSSRTLKEKVERAVSFYAEKYGQAPTLCLINPAGLNGKEGEVKGVTIRPARSVMPHHLWVGVDDQIEKERQRAKRGDADKAVKTARRKKAA